MPEVRITKYIEASPAQVWNTISDIERAPEWVTVMKELISTTENPVTEGTVYRELSKVGPKQSETSWTVTVFNPPEEQVHQSRESDMHIDLTMQVAPDGQGTRLLHQTRYTMAPHFRPLGWLLEQLIVKRTMSREMHQSVDTLQNLVENQSFHE